MAGQVKKQSVSEGVSITGVTDLSFGTQITPFTIADNETGPTDVTGLLFDSGTTQSSQIVFSIVRNSVLEQGTLYVGHDGSAWSITQESYFNDNGVTFTITAGGQVQYSSTSTGFAGTLRALTVNLDT